MIEFKIYCDLDGVLVAFDEHVKTLLGDVPGNLSKRYMWATVHRMISEGKPFWSVMPKKSDADELWDFIKPFKPDILTATGRMITVSTNEKTFWVNTHYPEAEVVHFVEKSEEKAQFATPTSILIDDRIKSIDPWVAAGGIGILHTSASDSIAQLKKILCI